MMSETSWEDLDEETREDLTNWRNARNLTKEDKELLARLHVEGRFKAWDCPSCGDRVYEAEPESWDDFQGASQNDRTSYPGLGESDPRCDSCRCHNKGGPVILDDHRKDRKL